MFSDAWPKESIPMVSTSGKSSKVGFNVGSARDASRDVPHEEIALKEAELG